MALGWRSRCGRWLDLALGSRRRRARCRRVCMEEPEPEASPRRCGRVPPGTPRTLVREKLPASASEDIRLLAGFCRCGRPIRTVGHSTCCGVCRRGDASPWAEAAERHTRGCARNFLGFWFVYHDAGQVIADLENGRIAGLRV